MLVFFHPDHPKYDDTHGACEVIVRKKVTCDSDDPGCTAARLLNENHGHIVSMRCGTTREDAVPVCFMPLIPRLAQLFSSSVQCHNHLALWRGIKPHVLDHLPVDGNRSRENIWNGDRVMKELLWFWDPNRYYSFNTMLLNEVSNLFLFVVPGYICYPHCVNTAK